MSGALRRTMLYLGLAEGDDEVNDTYLDGIDVVTEEAMREEYAAEVTPIRRSSLHEVPVSGGDLRRITTIHPRSYNDARLIGEAFRGGTPVIMNLTDMDDGDAKRLVDFAAGLIFGLHGAIERVTNKVFLLSPENIEILGEDDVEPLPGQGVGQFYNQS